MINYATKAAASCRFVLPVSTTSDVSLGRRSVSPGVVLAGTTGGVRLEAPAKHRPIMQQDVYLGTRGWSPPV